MTTDTFNNIMACHTNLISTQFSFIVHSGTPCIIVYQYHYRIEGAIDKDTDIIVAPYAVLELVVTSTDAASLITNHMHMADFKYSAGKLLARTHPSMQFLVS